MSELFIDGEWVAGTGHAFASRNPGTGATVWEGNSASAEDVDRAVMSARRAFALWSVVSLDERVAVVRRFAALITERKESIAEAIGRETGKPLWEARTEVASMAAKVDISVQSYNERTGERRAAMADGTAVLRHRPHGVVAVFANHRQIDGLFFTGSSDTGTLLHKQFGGRPEIVLALEMGGNNPLVVAPVADLDAAVHHTIQSAFLSAGQRCTCARRIFVPNDAFGDQFLARLVEVSSRIAVGEYNADPQPYMGAVISARAAARLVEAQERLIADGAKPLLKMEQRDPKLGFVSPAILDVTNVTNLPDEEHFGPLAQIVRYGSFDDAISGANDTEFGLSAGLLADDEALWTHFQRAIRAGIVNWNRPTNGASSAAPFGGTGRSGNNRPSAYYAADYCAYPMASVESAQLQMPASVSPGLHF